MKQTSYPDWLPTAVIYQIYPQSFQDSNGDGIGDLQGIVSRLDYIKSLGANTLWLTPIFDSPFEDAGYDVSDYYRIAPQYGDEADLHSLFDEAHRRGMRVILDLVPGHTSIHHEWFQWEAQHPRDPESNRYIWINRDFDLGTGPAKEDFMPSFFWYQPALNYGWDHPTEPWQDPVDAPGPRKNREEMRRILAHWLDMGADGFRVDMAATLVKQDRFDQGLGSPGTAKLWSDLRAWWDTHYPDRLLVAEWSSPEHSIPAGFHLDFMMHFNAPGFPSLFFNGVGSIPDKEGPCYFDAKGNGRLEIFRESYARQLKTIRGRGYVSLPSANHDIQRLRCGERDSLKQLKPAWVFLLTQAGPPTIYYGDEIGMRYVPDTPPKEGSTLVGITASNAGAADGERAGTRTPMQWDDSDSAGFSDAPAERFYMPLDPDPDRPSVAAQENDPESQLSFVKHLLELRSQHPVLAADADYEILSPVETPFPFIALRQRDGQAALIVLNPSDRPQRVDLLLPDTFPQVLLNQGIILTPCDDGQTILGAEPFGYSIFLRKG